MLKKKKLKWVGIPIVVIAGIIGFSAFVSSDESGGSGCPVSPCSTGYTCKDAYSYIVNGSFQILCPASNTKNTKCCYK